MFTLAEKIQLKNLVREELNKCVGRINMTSTEGMTLVWETIAEVCEKTQHKKFVKIEEEQPEETMNFNQAQAFRNIEIPFGAHKGTKVGDLEPNYLRNLCSPNDFIKKLRRYLSYLDSIGGS